MQAIIVKILRPTNTKGKRLKATSFAGSIVKSWNYSCSNEQNYLLVAQALVDKFQWNNIDIVQGVLPNNDHVFVMVNKNDV